MKFNLEIDYDMASNITVSILKEYKKTLTEELIYHKGSNFMHEDDVVHSNKMIQAIDFVLKDFTV